MTAETGFANITPVMFENGPLRLFGKTVTRYAATETTNTQGEKTYSYGTGTSITAILHRRSGTTNLKGQEGFVTISPAYIMVLATVTLNFMDKILDPNTGETFIIKMTPIDRRGVYKFADLYYSETVAV